MSFRFYSNIISQASRRIVGGIFTVGLVLIGFGLMIFLLPLLFATLAAIVFFTVGIGTCLTAAKMFFGQRAIDKEIKNDSDNYRKNVQIRAEDHYDI